MPIQTRAMLKQRAPLQDLEIDLTGDSSDEATNSVVCMGMVPVADKAVKKRRTGGNNENARASSTNRQRLEYMHEEYMQETIRGWLARETRLPPFLGSHEINRDDREYYVITAITTAYGFKYREESLHLGMRLADRYLSIEPGTDLDVLKAIVLTGLWVGVKFHENHNDTPSVDTFAHVATRFSRSDLIDLETQMLKALNYDVSGPTAAEFLRALKTIKPPHLRTPQQINLATFLADASLLIYELVSIKASLLALVVVAIARGSSYRGVVAATKKGRPFFLTPSDNAILPLMGYLRQDLYFPAMILVNGINGALSRGVLDFMINHHKLETRSNVSDLMLAGLDHLRTAT